MSHSKALPPAFVAAAEGALPRDIFSFDPDDLTEYGKDWTKVFPPNPAAISRPRTTAEIATLLRLCAEHGVAVVPSGGRTGLAAGAVATHGELVLSLARMRRMDPVDTIGATVRVQAGVVTEEVHRHAAEHGLTWPVDFASKGSSQVGGNIATNAGGVKVIRYGLTRNWVLGLEVVLMGGTVLNLNGALEKNNTGTDLRQLFIGSEGTLGVITEATLKLTRQPGKLNVFLFAVASLGAVLELFREARKGPFAVMAYEFFTDRCFARVEKHRKLRLPLETQATHYVLLEIEQADEGLLESWMASLFERDLVVDGTMAQSSSQASELWALREGISESLSATGLPHKNDIALPVAELDGFCSELESVFSGRYAGWEICAFGHIGDGNLHINVMKPDALDTAAFRSKTKEADHDIFRLVKAHHGTISAEHGIGLLKKDYLGYSRSPEEIEVMRAVKRALDPKNLLNPGKILDV